MKSVLVSYLERNKIIKLPQDCEDGDVGYLKKEFQKHFSFGNQVSIDLTLQRYDDDWKEFIDLDAGDTVANKDKLKVVVSSHLHTPSPANTEKVNVKTDETKLMPLCSYLILVQL